MAITYVGTGALASGTTSPLVPALPSGVASGDLIVIVAVQDVNGASTVTATGYTEAAQHVNTTPVPDANLHILYKIAGGSESDPSVTFSSPTSGVFAFTFALRGVDGTTPLDGVTPGESTVDNNVEFTPTGITTATNSAWAIAAAVDHGNHTLSLKGGSEQGFTDRASGTSYQSATGSDASLILATKEIGTAGAVTMPTVQTGGATTHWVGITFSVRAAAGGTDATVNPATVTATASVPEMSASTSVTMEPSTVTASAVVPVVTVSDAGGVTGNHIYRRVSGDAGDGIRVAADVAQGGTFIDWATASGEIYEYRVEALASNGTSTFGEWT